jgi:hypothetical protein
LNVASKIFARCIFVKMQDRVEEILRKQHAGFRRGRACMDQTFIIRRIIKESIEYQRSVIFNFVDFE